MRSFDLQYAYSVCSMGMLCCCFAATDGIVVSVAVVADVVAVVEVVVGC